ncbi:F1F0 ATP synthase subunit e, mitochondrial [Oleoguttula sp. CCFEE 5521]|nr:hypothetical protein B0A51_00781 [Rachicladosporium sp. CCFEE 5018]
MASTGVNVLRWGALVFGVFYGFSHQTAISTKDKLTADKHEYERKQKLIADAKAAWQRKNAPSSGTSQESLSLDDPRFDIEAYMKDIAGKKL